MARTRAQGGRVNAVDLFHFLNKRMGPQSGLRFTGAKKR